MKILVQKETKFISGGIFAAPGIKPDAFNPKPAQPTPPPAPKK
jgi:hypothetical protein